MSVRMFNYITSSLLIFLCAVPAESSQSGAGRVKRLHAELDRNAGLQIVYDSFNPRALAWASFQDSTMQEGWAYLHVETNPKFADGLTAYAAGVLEAYATKTLVRYHEQNRYANFCAKFKKFTCDRVIKYLQEQVNYMYEMATNYRLKSDFWNQVYLILQQLTGLNDAYTGRRLNHGNRFMPSENLTTMIVNWEADLFDIEQILPIISPQRQRARMSRLMGRSPQIGLYERNTDSGPKGSSYASKPPGHCSALIKYTDNNLYIGHTSWFDYSSMLRIEKKYNFSYRKRGDSTSAFVPGRSIVMTSYPGVIYSLDEFYLIQSGLFVMETSLDFYTRTSMKYCKSRSVPTWIRSMAANRLADSGKKWVEIFSQENSGTYNNQYMIVDFKKFEDGKRTITDNVLWVLEQMPGSFVSKDMSDVLRRSSFYSSFNIPLFAKTRKLSGAVDYDEFTNFYKYESNPRKLIFNRDHHGVDSIRMMIRLMRYNDYKHDNLSVCYECKPPVPVATFALAPRADLVHLEKHPVYIFKGLIGSTDAKAIDFDSFKRQTITLVNGPPNEHVPMFKWSSTSLPRPAGHPDKYDFPPVAHEFEASLQHPPSARNSDRRPQRALVWRTVQCDRNC